MILYNDENTYKLEAEENWLECIDYLRLRWAKDKLNTQLFLKLAITIWYVLTFDGPIFALRKTDSDRLILYLTEMFDFFRLMLPHIENCQWMFGYMIEVRTDLFLNTGLDYFKLEETGKSLLRQASEKGNIFAQIFLGNRVAKQEIEKCIGNSFDPIQEVDRYFIEIISVNFYDDK